jgi:uncharacterized membrane protein YkoI
MKKNLTPSRKAVVAVALASSMLFGAGAAHALANLDGNDRSNDLVGTNGPDRIDGRGGDDDIYGRGGNDILLGGSGADDIEAGSGNDWVVGGPGRDDLYGGPGSDRIDAVDRDRDDIECGPGNDRVRANPGDLVARDCEQVTRSGAAVAGTTSSRPTAPSAPATPTATVITASQAGQIAARHVGGGVVDHIEREDDYGAAWEVDVYTPRGEYEVYVSATGRVVRVLGPFAD